MFLGSSFGTRKHRKVMYKEKINLHGGINKIALLSVAMGLPVSLFYFILFIYINIGRKKFLIFFF